MASIIDSLSSSIKVSITSSMLQDLSRHLRLRLHQLQGEFGAVPQVQSCIDNFIPNGNGGGMSRTPCRSKNSCIWCTPQELAKERSNISNLLQEWGAEGLVLFVTLNLKFPQGLELGAKYQLLKNAWTLFIADSRVNKLRVQNGLKYVRVLEEVVSDGVWFPHFHLVMALKETPGFDAEELKRSLRQIWTAKAHKVGLIETLTAVQHISTFQLGTHLKLADYLVKHGRVGLYLDTDSVETSVEGMSPFHVFQLFVATGDADAGSLWSDFQFFSIGQRRISYSKAARVESIC